MDNIEFTIIDKLEIYKKTCPEKLALGFKKHTLTYGELYEKVVRIGSFLSEMQIKKGDRVLFSALSKPEAVAVYQGIQYCGAIAVFIDKSAMPKTAYGIYENTGASLFITDQNMREYAEKMNIFSMKKLYAAEGISDDRITERVVPDRKDTAELLYTTGTTGKPKGVILTYGNVYAILNNTIRGIGYGVDDVALLPLPLNHSFALRVMRALLFSGATVILQNGFAFARETETNQETFSCNSFVTVAASLEIMKGQMQGKFYEIMQRFSRIEVGAGSLSIKQRKSLGEKLEGTKIYNTWGSSETGGAITVNITDIVKNSPEKIGTLGKSIEGIEVAIFKGDGSAIVECSPQHYGRMALRGDFTMAGYYGNEALTRETIREDGFLLTGDLVYRDEDGYFYMLGRADDIINVGGDKVSPIEVEETASSCDGIKECACVGVSDPDGMMGQIPVLFVVPSRTDISEQEINTYLSERLERFKLPGRYIMIDMIPRNKMGKIDRKKLSVMFNQRDIEKLMNPVIRAILARRSVRNYTERPVPENVLSMILKAGYYAPSGHNLQTWRFTVIRSREKIEELKTVTKEVCKRKKVICHGFENPPCLILISNDRRNANGCQDASCAAENIFLAALSYGLSSVWLNPLMTICDEKEIRDLLEEYGIPDEHIVWCMAAIGYSESRGTLLAKKEDVIRFVD